MDVVRTDLRAGSAVGGRPGRQMHTLRTRHRIIRITTHDGRTGLINDLLADVASLGSSDATGRAALAAGYAHDDNP